MSNQRSDRIGTFLICLISLAICALVFTGVWQQSSEAAEEFDRTSLVRIGWNRLPSKLNLDNIDTIEDDELLSKIHMSLVATDNTGKIFSGVARKWNVSSDGTSYTFSLVKGLRFKSGAEFTCKDALASFNHFMSNHDSSLWAIALIKDLRCDSQSVFVINLKHPSPYFLSELSDVRYSVRSQREIELKTERSIDGLGPYQFDDEASSASRIVLHRKDEHPLNNKYSPQSVEIFPFSNSNEAHKAVETGLIDLYPVRGTYSSGDSWETTSNRINRVWMMVASHRSFGSRSSLIRCVNLKLNRKTLVSGLKTNFLTPTSSLVFFPSKTSNQRVDNESPDSSNICSGSAQIINVAFLVGVDKKIQAAVENELGKLNLKINKIFVERKNLSEFLNSGNYDLALYSIGTTSSKVSDLAYFYSRNPAFPPSMWMKSEFSELVHGLVDSQSDFNSTDLIDLLVSKGLNDSPVIPLFFERERFLSSKCAKIIDPDSFRMNQQFSYLVRLRNCRNDET